ncbi:phage head-tail adapter protein [Halalkalibacillus sediminis]|uniref:Phage head-tail adapter protein n=1 Tax=Halalkalibacillus sediminis TaxID=2018042 RepID=A0A2I0QXZ6_9BACI|nr:phage head-tail adapter protein [Halalkalibacillus sediminis]PKR79189.1 phage head-tail adapter protein [Halalkalibacillus sediminis]
MRKFEYKPPRVHSGELRTPVKFYEAEPNEGPLPGSNIQQDPIYEAWAEIDEVWLRDVELAKSNGTLSDVTVIIRDPLADFIPSNKHYVEIDAPEYKGQLFNVKQAQPDMQHKDFINVIAELRS